MVNPIIDLLEGAQRAALPFLQSGVEVGLSANKIIDSLQAAGLGIRRADALNIIRQLKGQQTTKPYVASVGLDKQLDPSRFATSATVINARYSYLVKVSGRSLIDNSRTDQFISVSTDDLLTKAEAVNAAMDAIAAEEEKYGMSVESATVSNVFNSPLFV